MPVSELDSGSEIGEGVGERYFGGGGDGTWEQIDVEGSEKS